MAHPNHPVGEAAHPGRLQTGGAGTRIECRIPDADRNPYLACATTLAAGLHGIDNELELPKVFEGNMYAAKRVPDVPKTLREALAAFKKSKVLHARPSAIPWSTTTSTPASGSSWSTTAGSPTGS